MTEKLVSICIPTFNRAPFLRELLESILAQPGTDQVDVIISDDASEDNTASVVEDFRRDLPNLRYFRAEKRLRYDRNVLNVVSLATTHYCWLFGDDDRLEPGGLKAVLDAIDTERSFTGLTTGRVSYDRTLNERTSVRPLQQQDAKRFRNAEDAFISLLDRLGFLSCQVINRERWTEIAAEAATANFFAGYVQLYVMARMIRTWPDWIFLPAECVGFRSDNDSFQALGTVGRLKMDVRGYDEIAGAVFGRHSHVYRTTMAEVATTHARHHIMMAKRANAPISFTWSAFILCVSAYRRYPRFWIETFPVLLMPAFVAVALRDLLHRIRNAG